MGPADFVKYGFESMLFAFLIYVIKELWADNRELRAQMHADQAAMLPALNTSQASGAALLEQTVRSAALAERERQQARDEISRALELSTQLRAMLDRESR